MTDLVLSDIDDDLRAGLERRAARHGRSLEAELREILREAAEPERITELGLGSRIAARFEGWGLTPDELPPERNTPLKPLNFDP